MIKILILLPTIYKQIIVILRKWKSILVTSSALKDVLSLPSPPLPQPPSPPMTNNDIKLSKETSQPNPLTGY